MFIWIFVIHHMDAKIAVYNQTLIESDVHGKILSLKNNNFLMVWLPYNYIVNIVHVSMFLIVVCYHVFCVR